MNFAELGFHRVAAVRPEVFVGDPEKNAESILVWMRRAAEREAGLALFPELAVTGYTCEDLFHSRALLEAAREALAKLAEATQHLPVTVVGAPFPAPDGRLYNCAFVLARGCVRGAIPKTYLPNYGEFYEKRWFASGGDADLRIADPVLGEFRFSPRQIFEVGEMGFAVEVCEDLWAPIPPSSEHALAGATVILNLSASNDLVAKADYRRDLVRQQSARLNAAYVYASCGPMESTKDVVYGGHTLIAENGAILAEGERFGFVGGMITADLDVDRLRHERIRNATFASSPRPRDSYVTERLAVDPALATLERSFARTPFVPDDPATVHARAKEILHLQSAGLARRLLASRSETAVIGVSGGLDSTLALLVSVEAMKILGRPPSSVVGVTMPGFGTSKRTKSAATTLAERLGITFLAIPIGPAVEQHFRDLGHDPANHDVVYQNSQARERTQILFDLANQRRGIVVGTGDLSELALGWCTFNGDHMSNYGVNASVPKTLVQHLIRWYAEQVADSETRKILEGILSTTISPELVPETTEGIQSTEEIVGPYVLHDFFLYHHMRNGFSPRKILALAGPTFAKEFAPETIRKWLRVFVERFYRQQFKRTCLPAGPKVGSVSLSPRGDWRMPDEVDPGALLREIER